MHEAFLELLVVGLSHRTAPLEVRESIVFEPEQVLEALRSTRADEVLHETMILSTCNRTEVYSLSSDPTRAEAYVREFVSRFKGNDAMHARDYSYAYRDRETARHLFRVAAGIDSMVLGEAEILGQVKEAYNLACEGGSAGVLLNRLLSAALRVGKRARAETAIGAGAVSIASAAVALTTKIFSDLSDKRILVVGAGDTGSLAARHFAKLRPAGLLIANRTLESAVAVAEELSGNALPLAELASALAVADVVVCATRFPGALIDADLVRRVMRPRGDRPLVIVDIAVPRNVDPAVDRLDSVFSYSIDALQTIVDANLVRRRREVPRVEAIIDEEVDSFFKWVRSLEVTPVVRALRERFEQIRAEEVRRHERDFDGAARERLDALTQGLVNKLLHGPTVRIKQFDLDSEDGLVRLDTVRDLFGLHDEAGDRKSAGKAGQEKPQDDDTPTEAE